MNPIDLQDLQVIVDTLGDLVNVSWKLTHGGSIFSALVLSGDFSKISLFKKQDVLDAFKNLDAPTRQSLEQRLIAKVVEVPIASYVNVFERAVALAYSGCDLYNSGKQLVLDAEALFGVSK